MLRGGACIERIQPAARIGRRIAVDGVGHAAFLADTLKQARGHAAAEQVVKHGKRINIRIAQRNAGETDAQVYLFDVLIPTAKPGVKQRSQAGMSGASAGCQLPRYRSASSRSAAES